jgi:chromate transport protein ChrA
MKIKSDIWSNSFFIIPLIITIYYQLILYSIIISLVIIFSTLYHLNKKNKFKILDRIFAWLLIIYNLYTIYLSNFKQPYTLLAIIFVFIGLYFLYYKKRDNYEWHLSSSIITLFCIISLVT